MEKRRVACIIPPFYRLIESKNNRLMPAMHYVAETLYQRGHEMVYINGDYADNNFAYADRPSMVANNWLFNERYKKGHNSFEEIIQILERYQPEFVFIAAGDVLIPTVEIGSIQSCLYLAKRIKSIDSQITCIGYGFLLRNLMKDDMEYLDAVIVGEGEVQAVEIVELGKRGLLEAKWTKNMDALPTLTDTYLYYKPGKEDWDYIMSMRGCMHQCTFCFQPSFGRGQVSKMSPKRFIDEIKFRIKQFGTMGFYFLDMIFLPDSSSRTYEMLDELIKLKDIYPEFHWWAEAKCNIPSIWNDEIVEKIKKSGCKHLKFGVEMTNDNMLQSINKGITYDEIRQSFAMVQKYGIDTTAYVLLGLSGYSDEDYKQMWIKFKNLKASNYVININVPYPGTKFYEQMNEALEKEGISRIEDFTHTSLVMQKFWGISDETLKLYFSLEGQKDDSETRKYIRKIVDKNLYETDQTIRYVQKVKRKEGI